MVKFQKDVLTSLSFIFGQSPHDARPTHIEPLVSRALVAVAAPWSILVAVMAAALSILAVCNASAAGSLPTTGFLAAPTDQIAVPGMISGAEITPEGDLYTGWAEYELRFGRRLAPWDQPTRTLPDPALPLLSSALSDGPMRYVQTVFAVAVAGLPVAYDTVTVTNGSDRPREARVAMAVAYTRGQQLPGAHGVMTGAYRYERPVTGEPGFYDQPGQPFSQAFAYSAPGRDLDRSGLLLARGPATPSRPLGASEIARRARPLGASEIMGRARPLGASEIMGRARPLGASETTGRAAPITGRTAPHDGRLFAVPLKAGGRVSLTWQIPLSPPPAGAPADSALDHMPLSSARAELRRMWNAEEAGMMKISVPEAKVSATYRAAITEILCSRFKTPAGWVQGVNRLQYQAFWIRDGAIETQALDLAGLHTQAAQNLAFMDTLQQPAGLLISRPYQYDGLGQALWAIGRHAQLTSDPAYARAQLTRIGAAVEWLSWVTATDPLGLLPAGNPGDDELAYGHITGDDLWAAAGLRSGIADAVLAGRGDLAAAWQALATRFEASLEQAITVAVARAGHIPPVLDSPDGQDWGNYYAAYPVQVLPAGSPAIKATTAWARAHMVQGLPTYAGGRSLHDYLGFPIFQTELAGGEASEAIAGLYSELVHTTSTDNGWEWGIAPFGYRGSPIDLAPHGTFSGDYVALLRNMLVTESPGGGVSLLAGAGPAWLAPGGHIAVTAAPTDHGTVSFVEHSTAHGETLTWKSALTPGTALTWTLPAWARHARISSGPARSADGRTIALHAHSGSVTVVFGGHRPAQSYALAAASLNSAYRARGLQAPLAPATR